MTATAPLIIEVDPEDRPAWHTARRHGIGSSDAAAIFGMNPWRSPLTVYLDKTGQIDDHDGDSPALKWGRRLEAAIADEFAERHDVVLWKPNVMFAHPEHQVLIANPDRVIVPPEIEKSRGALDYGNYPLGFRAETGAEMKTSRKEGDWEGDQPPDYVLIQVQHQLLVLGWETIHVAVLLHGRIYNDWLVQRDPAAIDLLVNVELEFWDRVQRRDPPSVDALPSTSQALKRLYDTAEPDTSIELGLDGASVLVRLTQAKAAKGTAEAEIERLENELRARLGDNEAGVLDGRQVVTWKNQDQTILDRKALEKAHPAIVAEFTTTEPRRVLRVKKEPKKR